MSIVKEGADTWVWATVDTVFSVFAFVVIWYPALHYTNKLVGFPLDESRVAFGVGVLALVSAYPFVAGNVSLGDLGEYLFLFLVAAFGWGIVGMIVIIGSGLVLSGSDVVPQAVVWGLAYFTAYLVVFRTKTTIFR